MHLSTADQPLLAACGLKDFATVLTCKQGERLDKSGLESWRQRWRLSLTDGQGQRHCFYLKRFDRPPLRRQWRRWLSGQRWLSTAAVEWQNAQDLAAWDISAVRPAGFGQKMCGPWERQSFVLLREALGVSMEKWTEEALPPLAEDKRPQRRRELVQQLARLIGRFHKAGFVHRDLYLCHIFIRQELIDSASWPMAGQETFSLIDVQRVFRPRCRRRRWILKDLAALHFSTPADRVGTWERLRFLCRYAREVQLREEIRHFVRGIHSRAEAIRRRQERRIRRLRSSAVQ